MSLPDDISELVSRFEYEADRLDGWHVLKNEGSLRGDCDDFALTAAMVMAGGSWRSFWRNILKGKAGFYRCHTGTAPHIIYYHPGLGYIDNIKGVWMKVNPYRSIFPGRLPVIMVAAKIIAGRFWG